MSRFFVLLLWIFAACSSSVSEGTLEMVAELEMIAAETDQDPRRNAHANQARAAELRSFTLPQDTLERIQYEATLATELLHAGESEEAVEIFERILETIDSNPNFFDSSWRLAVMDHLALSYLRIGEQQNCLLNHAVARCLFPITAEGVHSLRHGSEMAIHWYEQILKMDSTDLNSIWLLNLAHMTLGSHPDGVDAQWLIPMQSLQTSSSIQRFDDVAPQLGINIMGLSGGVVLEDLSGDGWLDLMVSSWGLRDQLRYFENDGRGRLKERTDAAGLTGLMGGLNLIHADYDNDGDQDIFVLRGAWLSEGHPNSLLRNNGHGRFEDVTREAGVYSRRPTQTAAWNDFDLDGDLDLFVGNESNPMAGIHKSELFVNQGDGTFLESASDYELDRIGYMKAVTWGDYNDDGWPDVFISRYLETNLLLRNEMGHTFTDVSAEAGIQEPLESFPAWFWDFDQDGLQDLFVSGWRATAGDIASEYLGHAHNAEYPRLYRNLGTGTFEDVTQQTQLNKVMYTMGSNIGDLDGDGWLDFYVGTGDPNLRAIMPNRMFRNVEGHRFEEVTTSGGFGHLQKGHGVAFGDLDHDGDQDIYQVMGGAFEGDLASNTLFENPGHGHAWVILSLEGATSNRDAIGAKVTVMTDTRTIYRVVGSQGSFGSSPLRLEIGLGESESIDELMVEWPNRLRTVDRFSNVPIRQLIRIREGTSTFETVNLKAVQLSGGDD
ncbi:MAG: CRTAC1 family protein [Bacteroidetes bacterium]|nr:CRTAC1 family protein [Bacteroidota bacterium]